MAITEDTKTKGQKRAELENKIYREHAVSGDYYRQKFAVSLNKPDAPYENDIASEICARLAAGESVANMCLDAHMPGLKSIFKWLHLGRMVNAKEPYKAFVDMFDEARRHGTDAIVEDLFLIADDGHNDWMEKHYGDQTAYVVNGEAVGRSKLRVEARMWYLSKINPKKYGEKIDVTTDGEKLPTPLYGGASIKPDIIEGEIVKRKQLKA